MDWIHCNCCYGQPNENKKFSLTSCGHLYCEDCVVQAKEKCKVCGQQCTAMVLAAPVRQDVAVYFTDSSDTLQQHFREIIKVMDFQKGHGRRLLTFYQKKVHSLNHELQEALKKLKDTEKENDNLKQENAYMKKVLNQSPFSRGVTAMSQSTANFSSAMSTPSHRTVASTPNTDLSQNKSTSLTSTPITMGRLSIFSPLVQGKLGHFSDPKSRSSGSSVPVTKAVPETILSSLSNKRSGPLQTALNMSKLTPPVPETSNFTRVSQSSGSDTFGLQKSSYSSQPYSITRQTHNTTS